MEIPLNDEEMLDILGSLLMDEFYASEIWQPVPAATKRKKAKARRKPGERYVPNYSYKPRGEKPWVYYREKIESVGEWLVSEAKDVNYALRVYEGWLEQAVKNIAKGEWYHAVLIIDVLFWEVARYHYVHGKNYPKQQARMRKLERAIMEQDYKLCEYSKEKNLNWVEEDLRDLYRLLGREPFSKNEGGFDMQVYINKVLQLLPEEKAQEWRDAHPTKEDLLKKEVEIELPKRLPFPDGVQDDEKEILLFDVFGSLPFEEYVSLAESLFRLFLDSERGIKAFKLFSTDDWKKMKSDYEEFNLVAHRIKKYVSYNTNTIKLSYLVSRLFGHKIMMEEWTEKKRTFVQNLIDKALDLIWRDWKSEVLREKVSQLEDKCQKRRRLKAVVEKELAVVTARILPLSQESFNDHLMCVVKMLQSKVKWLYTKYLIVSPSAVVSLKSALCGMELAQTAGMPDMVKTYHDKALTKIQGIYQSICLVAFEEDAKDVARQKFAMKMLERIKEVL